MTMSALGNVRMGGSKSMTCSTILPTSPWNNAEDQNSAIAAGDGRPGNTGRAVSRASFASGAADRSLRKEAAIRPS